MSSKAQARANIYSRLNSAPVFHPSTVSLFTDFTHQGGDIITVQSGNTSYTVPIYGSTVRWNGTSKVTAESSGKQYRGSLGEMAEKEYSKRGGGGGYRGGVRDAEANRVWGNAFYSEDGVLHSLIAQTSTNIMMVVNDVNSDLHSFIEQTPDMIRAEVGSAVSGFAESVIEQTATYIRTEVRNAASAISESVIEQTAEYVRTEVESVASGVAWSVITQTVTGIVTTVGQKARVFVMWNDPVTAYEVHEHDIWVKTNSTRTWAGLATGSWYSRNAYKWREYYGAELYVRKNGGWELIGDQALELENEVNIEHEKDRISIVGEKIQSIDGELVEFNSRLQVTAQQIRGDVSTAKSNLYSVVMQTATNVFSGVYDKVNDNFSTIEQTSTSIDMAVNSAKSSLYSAINVTSTQISLKVGKGEIISSINVSSESITISSSKVNLEGYVKATDITSEYLYAKISALDRVSVNSLTSERGGISVATVATTTLKIGGGNTITRCIASASVSGNTLTLTDSDGNTTNFSKATTLSGEWVSGAYTVTASPQGNTITTGGLSVASGQARRDGNLLYVPVTANAQPTGYEAWVNWKDLLTSHSNCVSGLSRYNTTSPVTLYVLSGSTYMSVGSHYWYHKNTNSSLTTYYS